MNDKILKEYAKTYYPYSRNRKWVDWCARVQPIKAQRTIKLLKKYKPESACLLDYGCSVGLTYYYLAKTFKRSVGLDIDESAIKTAEKFHERLKLRSSVKQYDGKNIPFPDKSFDIVTAIEVWEHVDDVDNMVREIHRVLKPGGVFHVTTANKLWPIEPHYKLPFLSYLPYPLADLYVRLFKRADFYHDIHLPTYGEFKKKIERYFEVEDVTLDSLINYKFYQLDKERGELVALVGRFLNIIKKLDRAPLVNILPVVVGCLLVRISLGWLFIAKPKDVA